jgi:hypothetical protein
VVSTGTTVFFPRNSACRSTYQILIFIKSAIIISTRVHYWNLPAVNIQKLTFSWKVVSCWKGYVITAITLMYLDHASIEAWRYCLATTQHSCSHSVSCSWFPLILLIVYVYAHRWQYWGYLFCHLVRNWVNMINTLVGVTTTCYYPLT